MQKLNTENKPATKKDLEALEKSLRGDLKVAENGLRGDMKALEGRLKGDMKVMENRLKGDMKALEGTLRMEVKLTADGILSKVDENARNYRDQILTRLDEVMGELETKRENDTLESYQTAELKKAVDNHEKRIRHLEEL